MVNPQMRTAAGRERGVVSRRTSGAMREAAGPVLLGAVVLFLLYWLIAGPMADTALASAGWPGSGGWSSPGRRSCSPAVLGRRVPGAAGGAARVALHRAGRGRGDGPGEGDVARDRLRAAFRPSELADRPGPRAGGERQPAPPRGIARTPRRPWRSSTRRSTPSTPHAPLPPRADALDDQVAVRLDYAGPLLAPSEVEAAAPRRGVVAAPRRAHARPGALAPRRAPPRPARRAAGRPRDLLPRRRRRRPGSGASPSAGRPDTPRSVEPRQADRLVVPAPGAQLRRRAPLQARGLPRQAAGHPRRGRTSARWRAQGGADATGDRADGDAELFRLAAPAALPRTAAPSRATPCCADRWAASLDLSHLTATRCVILMGHLPDAPLPAPLTVARSEPPSRGWTTVRVIFDLK